MQSERSLEEEILNKFYKGFPVTIINGLFKYPRTTQKDSISLVVKYDNETLIEAKNYLDPMFKIHRKYNEQIKTANKVNKYIRIEPYKLIYLAYPKSKKDDDPDSRYYEISKNLKQLSKIVKHKITWITKEENSELSIANVIEEGKNWLFGVVEDYYKEVLNKKYYMKNNRLSNQFNYMVKLHRTKQCITYLIYNIIKQIMKNVFKGNIEEIVSNKGGIISFISKYKTSKVHYYLSHEDTLKLMEIIELLKLYNEVDKYQLNAYEKIIELAENCNVDEEEFQNLYYDFFDLDTNAIIFYIGELLGAKAKLDKTPPEEYCIKQIGAPKKLNNICYPCSTIIEYE